MVLISGIGYSNLSDLSFGRVLLNDLAQMSWPKHVHVEDLNYGPIMILQWLEETDVEYDKAIFINAAKRGRSPGTLEVYRWDGILPDEEEIQARVEEAVTGVISLDNLLIVCKYFGALPADITIVEIEPDKEDWGLEFSPAVAQKVDEALRIVREEAIGNGH